MEILKQGAQELGLPLTPAQVRQFETFFRELISWNERVNLTAITGYEQVQRKHFLDSLTAIPWLKLNSHVRALDLGTGAGMPGLPIKLLLPRLHLVLLDSVAKKTAFLRHLIVKLEVEGVEVVTGRAEEVAHDPAFRERFNLVLCRATAKLPVALELGLPFCTLGGYFISYKQGQIGEELKGAERALALLGGRIEEIREINMEGLEGHRLVIVRKVSATPQRYPRRPGIPAKRPLT